MDFTPQQKHLQDRIGQQMPFDPMSDDVPGPEMKIVAVKIGLDEVAEFLKEDTPEMAKYVDLAVADLKAGKFKKEVNGKMRSVKFKSTCPDGHLHTLRIGGGGMGISSIRKAGQKTERIPVSMVGSLVILASFKKWDEEKAQKDADEKSEYEYTHRIRRYYNGPNVEYPDRK